MNEQQFPSADDQIMTRLQNAARSVLLELEAQGTALDSISGGFTVTITAGEINVSKPPVAGATYRAGKIKPADEPPVTTE